MADETDESRQEPNLELPSLLGFRRKKRGRKDDVGVDETTGDDTTAEVPEAGAPTAAEPTTMVAPTEPPEVVATPEAEEVVEHADVEETQPIAASPAAQTVTPPPPAPEPVPEPVPAPAPVPEPTPVPEPEPVPTPAPVPDPEPVPSPVTSEVEQTVVIPGPGAPAAAHHEPLEAQPTEDQPTEAQPVEQEFFHADPVAAGPGAEPVSTRQRPTLNLPVVDPRIAVVLTGVVVGLVGMVLATGSARGCEAVRGVGSCGGLGLLALLVVLAIEVVLGAALLRATRITDPASTAFLGVAMMAVIALLFLLGSLESPWMLVVLPIVTGLTFLLSWWVTVTFVDGGAD